MLRRGSYVLAHMSQILQRDEKAAEIAQNPNGRAHALMLTDDEVARRERGEPGTGLPYRFLVYAIRSAALNWTAFYTREDLRAFCEAYGITLSREPSPGETFELIMPSLASKAFAPLVDDGTPYSDFAGSAKTPIADLTQERAQYVMKCARDVACGPWSDHIETFMTESERAHVRRVCAAMPGSSCWMDAFFGILNRDKYPADYPEGVTP